MIVREGSRRPVLLVKTQPTALFQPSYNNSHPIMSIAGFSDIFRTNAEPVARGSWFWGLLACFNTRPSANRKEVRGEKVRLGKADKGTNWFDELNHPSICNRQVFCIVDDEWYLKNRQFQFSLKTPEEPFVFHEWMISASVSEIKVLRQFVGWFSDAALVQRQTLT